MSCGSWSALSGAARTSTLAQLIENDFFTPSWCLPRSFASVLGTERWSDGVLASVCTCVSHRPSAVTTLRLNTWCVESRTWVQLPSRRAVFRLVGRLLTPSSAAAEDA
eukprot:185083-Prymnesium_polylepis.2